jgi:hypothetical protein
MDDQIGLVPGLWIPAYFAEILRREGAIGLVLLAGLENLHLRKSLQAHHVLVWTIKCYFVTGRAGRTLCLGARPRKNWNAPAAS